MDFSFIDFVFFFYMFLGLYMLILFVLIYLRKREELFDYPRGKIEPVSIVVPCYNEASSIGSTIESLLSLDYPKDKLEVIVVDDLSSDNSVEVAKKYAKKYDNVRVIVNKRNSGGAAEPTNLGIKAAKYAYVAVADADSVPDRDALKKMIGFLQEDKNVAAVTCSVLVRNPKNFIQRLQAIEYAIIAWGRKLLDYIDAVYVTPGPFALYKKKALMEVGLFDTKNMTQDIEIVWRLLSKGYFARMCLATRVHSSSPSKFRQWFKQRIRWTIGGNQTLIKYKSLVMKKGILGFFIIPFFAVSLFLGIVGLGLYLYLFSRGLIVRYLSTKYSIIAQSSVFQFQELTFTPSILNFFGGALFFIGFFYLLFGLMVMKLDKKHRGNFFNVLFYSIVYLTVYPAVIIVALYKQFRGKYSW
jgi:cellulose synthase/poly-beta-1,6-N-acetylglucosamine synthase-like glycosyltransferase